MTKEPVLCLLLQLGPTLLLPSRDSKAAQPPRAGTLLQDINPQRPEPAPVVAVPTGARRELHPRPGSEPAVPAPCAS